MDERFRGVRLTCVLWLAWSAVACAPPKTTLVSADELRDADQWSQGVWLYGQHCAGCHGDDGAGDEDTPAIAGDGALPESPRPSSERTARFRTAEDVFAFVNKTMPPMAPGSLKPTEYWAVVAYALKQAGVKMKADLGPSNARAVELR